MVYSIYQRALGDQFHLLHPQLQKKFGLHSTSGLMIVSSGMMKRIWGGKAIMTPFFKLSAKRHISFPERGENIPFTLENAAYVDPFGREAVAWIRRFSFPQVVRNFDATMVYSEQKRMVIDYVGTCQSWVTSLSLHVLQGGGLRIETGPQRLNLPLLKSFIPFPLLGRGIIDEWYDDLNECFQVRVHIQQPWFGTILAYEGEFTAEYVPVKKENLPDYVFPEHFQRKE